MAHTCPRVPTMARPHILVSLPLGGPPHHSQEVSQTPLYSWPVLPLSVWYSAFDYQYSLRMLKDQRADVVTAFEYSDRICEICLPTEMGYSFWGSVSGKSFLELEHLKLYGPPFIILPHEFLCGPTPLPRLRTIFLRELYLPGLL